MTIGWPIAATTSGRLYLRFGFRTTMLIGSVIAVAGAALLLTVDASSSVLHLAAPNFVMGLGFGYVASPAIVAAQSSVGWDAAGWPPARRCSPGRWARPSGWRRSARSPTPWCATGSGPSPPTSSRCRAGVLDPAIHAVFMASFAVAVTLVVAAAFMPKKVDEVTG